MLEIYTDGGCIENPGGIGAWAFVVVNKGEFVQNDSGGEMVTTNNRTELWAVIHAMRWATVSAAGQVSIFTDSDLTVKCGNRVWKRKKNLDLWCLFDAARKPHYALKWVRGHNGNKWNELADSLCSEEMERLVKVRRREAEPMLDLHESNMAHMRSL